MADANGDRALGHAVAASAPPAFSEPGIRGEIHLLGHRCRDCGRRFFPARMSCIACYGHNLEPIRLDRIGKVLSFTIVRQAPGGYFGPVPYVIGNVALNDGVIVLSQLTGKPIEDWHRGVVVAAYVLRLPTGSNVQSRAACYGFRPADAVDMAGAGGSTEES